MKALLNPEIQSFIRANENADVAELALKKPPDAEWPYPLVLDQIKSRQKAKDKMPGWYGAEGIIFPAPSLVEQASSETTAKYKASLFSGQTFADLTAGAGVDFAALLENFGEGIAIEQDPETAEILSHNLSLLTRKPFKVINGKAEEKIADLPSCDLVYIDPQRRTEKGKGLFRFAHCSPDITTLLPRLRAKAVMIKASPVLDIDKAVSELGNVSAVHVVEWRGECREVLYVMERQKPAGEPYIIPVVINDEGKSLHSLSFTRKQEKELPASTGMPEKYLYEPSRAFQKAGCFKYLAECFSLKKLHPHTHLYTAADLKKDFPGRIFIIEGLYSAGGKDLPLKKANITVRNFPTKAEDLRKKLRLEDGGADTLFACTLANNQKILIHALKA